ncbi:hypothetical protein OG21DRAFT_902711 [Imleria badia]|nr:hypothetical protein OG21DRAFT_902711 [Imleria badia]
MRTMTPPHHGNHRLYFPSAFPHPHRPPNSYRPRETTATRSHPPPDDPVFQPARIRSLPEYVRHRLHQPRPGSGSNGSSSPDIIVESPSEPETTVSQPELLSPEAANRPLPQDDAHLHLHHHRPSHAHSQSQSEPPSRSRNEHRDQDRHHSRTQAESIVAQWRADNDASPPRNRPHSFTPSGVPHPHRRIVAPTALGDSNGPRPRRSVPTESAAVRSHPLPAVPASPHPHSRSEIVTPMPFGDVNAHRPPRRVPTESAAMLSHPLPDDSVSLPARTVSPLEHLRRRSRQPRRGSGSSSIPDIIVESPVRSPCVSAHALRAYSRRLRSANVVRT